MTVTRVPASMPRLSRPPTRPGWITYRLPFGPLEDAVNAHFRTERGGYGHSHVHESRELAVILGLSSVQILQARHRGVWAVNGDELAQRIDLHPYDVWGEAWIGYLIYEEWSERQARRRARLLDWARQWAAEHGPSEPVPA